MLLWTTAATAGAEEFVAIYAGSAPWVLPCGTLLARLAKQILSLFTVGALLGCSFGTLLAQLAKQILSLFTVGALLGVLLWHTAGKAGEAEFVASYGALGCFGLLWASLGCGLLWPAVGCLAKQILSLFTVGALLGCSFGTLLARLVSNN